MKGLNQFQSFDFEAFVHGKQFTVIGTSEYADFETKQHLGTKVDCVIIVDKTPYNFKDGKSFSNRFEKISFKVEKDVSIPLDAHVDKGTVLLSTFLLAGVRGFAFNFILKGDFKHEKNADIRKKLS